MGLIRIPVTAHLSRRARFSKARLSAPQPRLQFNALSPELPILESERPHRRWWECGSRGRVA